MSYLDEDLHPPSIKNVRVHFDQEAVPFSGDWAIVAKVTINGLYTYTYELRSGKWIGGLSDESDAEVRAAVETMWSKHLANIMLRDDSEPNDSDILQEHPRADVR